MASPSYRSLVAVLQGFRAHDARAIERLALATTTARGQATEVVALDPGRTRTDQHGGQAPEAAADADGEMQADTTSATPGPDEETAELESSEGADDGEQDERAGSSSVPLLRFSPPRDPGTVALFLRARVLYSDSEVWLSGYNALRTWVEETGDPQVTLDASAPERGRHHVCAGRMGQRTAPRL
ncbi:hypothetical protein OHT61_28835 [Streptomyces sp. NBC_00178]|uniref:hypothetical protein n=1 Tax=Streptomyces sp. NBC_00178 TaxID=2975672 RepID=UPI002E2B375F|nr:hypothetical protein [Streptomyces sp. NBC_00178]